MKRPWMLVIVGVLVVVVLITYLKYIRGEPGAPPAIKNETGKDDMKNADIQKIQGDAKKDAKKNEGVVEPLKGANKAEKDLAAAKAAEIYLEAEKARKANDPKAIGLYEATVKAAPTSEVAAQAAAFLGDHFYKTRETAKSAEYLRVALAANLLDDAQRKPLQEKLDELISNEIVSKETTQYVVENNDNLTHIGRKFDIPFKLVMKLNNLPDTRIRTGEKLKVLKGPFHITVEKGKFTLSAYMGDKYFKSYKVGLGKEDSTPEGAFKVEAKIQNPDWFRPGKIVRFGDPANLLGTRWIAFTKGYGIHGTWEPQSIGTQASEGCIRMLNKDVEELFDLVVVGKSTVTIKP